MKRHYSLLLAKRCLLYIAACFNMISVNSLKNEIAPKHVAACHLTQPTVLPGQHNETTHHIAQHPSRISTRQTSQLPISTRGTSITECIQYVHDIISYIHTLSKRSKGRLVGPFQHCIRRLIVPLHPNKFLHSSPEAPRTTQARETSASEGRNYYQGLRKY